MTFDDITDFAAALPRRRALAGLDLGTTTIGVAVSDALLSVATPLETIRRKKFRLDANALRAILDTRDIGGIVLGLPRNMDGSEGPRAQSTRAFARNLAALIDLPITFWDERLSTVAAERALIEADTSRRRRAEVIDHVAAGYILQGALDRLAPPGGSPVTAEPPIWTRDEIDSPCINVCVIHPAERICTGCLRTIDEITAWSPHVARSARGDHGRIARARFRA